MHNISSTVGHYSNKCNTMDFIQSIRDTDLLRKKRIIKPIYFQPKIRVFSKTLKIDKKMYALDDIFCNNEMNMKLEKSISLNFTKNVINIIFGQKGENRGRWDFFEMIKKHKTGMFSGRRELGHGPPSVDAFLLLFYRI